MRRKNQTPETIKDKIAETLIRLTEKTDFDSITVKDICEESGLGRSTYYRYFQNKDGKEDIVQYYIRREWYKFKERNVEVCRHNPAMALVRFAYTHQELCKWIEYKNLTYQVFKIFYDNTLSNYLGEYFSENIEVVKSFIGGGFFGLFMLMIESNFKISPEEFERISIEQLKSIYHGRRR